MPWTAQTTAEHVISVSEAISAFPQGATAGEIAAFLDLNQNQAEAALEMAVELTLLKLNGAKFLVRSSLCKFLFGPDQNVKSTVLRVVLEAFPPFITFRERWLSTADFAKAANQTAQIHTLTLHRDSVKDTLINLATFARVFQTTGGGQYEMADKAASNPLAALAQACGDLASAEQRVRTQLGPDASNAVAKNDVIDPLVNAILRCVQPGGARDAVVASANAVESFLYAEGNTLGLAVANAPGINAKLALFKNAHHLPDKLIKIGNYIGHVRNAADHGIDAEIGVTWSVQDSTGVEYSFVSCSFIANVYGHLHGVKGRI
ncbi:hypothetical protein [Granulicella arctica]|uniref:Uncharacterized protein n=1 Tax=Granulicella arctica TaxID=940613 RepID=A0A7Y9TKJ0_9BACT|nr:hypothetical protein [Granulicella arctica]NYF79287.1 hypothetical protein [Granulicella arctica]